MRNLAAKLCCVLVVLVGIFAYATLAVRRGEEINSVYILIAALCSYAIGYRFYSKWIAARVRTRTARMNGSVRNPAGNRSVCSF